MHVNQIYLYQEQATLKLIDGKPTLSYPSTIIINTLGFKCSYFLAEEEPKTESTMNGHAAQEEAAPQTQAP